MMRKQFKVMAMILVAVLGVSSNSALAASVSDSGYTSGGTAGKTLMSFTFSCRANYTTAVDACVISLSASAGNIIPMSYENVTSVTKAGALLSSSASGSTNGAVNSKTWIIGTGNAGTMHSSQVKKVTAGSAEFGTKMFEDVFTTY